MSIKRVFLVVLLSTLSACGQKQVNTLNQYSIGMVSYDRISDSTQQYGDLEQYLGTQLESMIEIEPAYNEIRALRQIASNKWDLVFAPPGLAAIAISQHNYQPIFSLEGNDNTRSVIVVKNDSSFDERSDLSGQKIILGQKGSATGYYLPLYNLYGVNLTEILYAPTPKNVLQWLAEDRAAAGALSLAQYNLYRRDFPPNTFKILHLDSHPVPSGAVLLSDRIERNQESVIVAQLKQTPSFVSSSAKFLPEAEIPDYDYLIKVIARVREITETNGE